MRPLRTHLQLAMSRAALALPTVALVTLTLATRAVAQSPKQSALPRASTTGAPSAVATDDSLVAAVRATGTRLATPRVTLWVQQGALDDSTAHRFLADADRAVTALVDILGKSLDRAHYREDTLHLFVSDGVGVSHVYGGYAHQNYDRPFLFLDAARVRRGEAPYVHESTHLLAWRFGSHSLREGIASWAEAVVLEREIAPGTGLFGMKNLPAIDTRAAELLKAEWIGTVLTEIGEPELPDPMVTSPTKPRLREAYYVLSTSFAKFLVTKVGVRRTIAAMEESAADGFARVTGRPLAAWKEEWLATLR